MFGCAYNAATYGLALAMTPKLIHGWLYHGKYRQSLPQRLGRNFPLLPKRSGPNVWIHAVSVGETKAVAPLVRKLKQELPNATVLISNITETGHLEAKRSIPEADAHVFLPFDFQRTTRRVLKQFSPDLVLVTETDIWYNFLKEARREGATVALINGKMSEQTQRRLARVPWVAKHLLGCFDTLCVQADIYHKRFLSLGVSEEKMTVTGNLKFDSQMKAMKDTDKETLRQRLGIEKGDKVVVLGSTHDPEERELLLQLIPLWTRYPRMKLLVVPRHPERFDAVAKILETMDLGYTRYSSPSSVGQRITLIDTMGLLTHCYQIADVAVVCGSFTEHVGGHNILEPCEFGVPTLFGPEMHAQPDMAELARGSKGALAVTMENIGGAIDRLLQDENFYAQQSQRACTLARAQKGATERSWEVILQKVRGSAC